VTIGERRHRLLRRRDEGVAEVRPIELFFDLVYVFAIGQLSHHLLEHVDLRTGAETAILTLAVIYAWYMTAWWTNWLEPDRLPVRLYLVGLMFASLLMSVGIADAFDGRAWLFVTGYLLFQLVRAAFLIAALRGKALGEHFVNELVWELATGVLWVAGAIADGDARLVLWGLAVVAAHGLARSPRSLIDAARSLRSGVDSSMDVGAPASGSRICRQVFSAPSTRSVAQEARKGSAWCDGEPGSAVVTTIC
jgi:low temperature requirement protein LtrA